MQLRAHITGHVARKTGTNGSGAGGTAAGVGPVGTGDVGTPCSRKGQC